VGAPESLHGGVDIRVTARDNRREQSAWPTRHGVVREVIEEKRDVLRFGRRQRQWRYLPVVERGIWLLRKRQLGPPLTATLNSGPREARRSRRHRQTPELRASTKKTRICISSPSDASRAAIRISPSLSVGMEGKNCQLRRPRMAITT